MQNVDFWILHPFQESIQRRLWKSFCQDSIFAATKEVEHEMKTCHQALSSVQTWIFDSIKELHHLTCLSLLVQLRVFVAHGINRGAGSGPESILRRVETRDLGSSQSDSIASSMCRLLQDRKWARSALDQSAWRKPHTVLDHKESKIGLCDSQMYLVSLKVCSQKKHSCNPSLIQATVASEKYDCSNLPPSQLV